MTRKAKITKPKSVKIMHAPTLGAYSHWAAVKRNRKVVDQSIVLTSGNVHFTS